MEYLHSKKVVHRDIEVGKYFNVRSSPNATVKLIDFGLSRLPQDGSEMRTICGSPLYVAPEILDMNLSILAYTPAVDMWSVGVILFILLVAIRRSITTTKSSSLKILKKARIAWTIEFEAYIGRREGLRSTVAHGDVMNRMTATQALQHPWIRHKHNHYHHHYQNHDDQHNNNNNNNNNSNNDIISNMTSETNSTGFTDGGSLTSSMNIQPPEQMPKEILEEKQNRLKQRLKAYA